MSVRDLSEIYNDPQSNVASQTTLTDKPLDSSSNQSNHRQDQSWTQPVSKTSDIEREPSVKSSHFLDDSTTYPPSVYQCDIKRASSIATAISMRRAEIITSRDNSQHPHNMLMRDEEETIMEEYPSSSGSSYKKHKNGADQLLLYEQKKSIIILLGRLLMKCGCPCHRVDETLQHTAKLLDLDASFTFLPDSILITFLYENNTFSIMVKSPPGLDTGKIGTINDIMNLFFRSEIDLDRCLVLLHEVATAPPTCGIFSTVAFFVLSSGTASVMMFGGRWMDGAISVMTGTMVAILYILSTHFPIFARVFEMSASICVAIVARALHGYCCFTSVAMSSILILLPGYTMTMGVIELSARHITTGVIRLVYAIFYAFQLAYGLQVGSSLYNAISPNSPEDEMCGQSVSPYFYILLLPILSVGIALSYGSSPKQWLSQTFSATIAFCVTYFLGKIIPDGQIVGGIAAFAIGLYSNFALKVTGQPPLVPLCVGITLLVPGSIGVRGAYSLLHQNDNGQGIFALQMLSIALGLSAGLFAAAMIVYPSGKKRSMYISL